MKPEALDAFATQSIRPGALDAAAADQGETTQDDKENNMTAQEDVSSTIPLLLPNDADKSRPMTPSPLDQR